MGTVKKTVKVTLALTLVFLTIIHCENIDGYGNNVNNEGSFDDKCTTLNCQNGGKCKMQDGTAVCDCPERYEGKDCEIDLCSDLTCQNGGTCEVTKKLAACKCPDQYHGEKCELDKCTTLNCQNGGKCKMQDGTAVCDCPERYEGKDCEIDKCTTLNCQNGGKCKMQGGTPVCDCPERYEGKDCEIDLCGDLACENGGTCEVTNKVAACKCRDQYHGEKCELEDLCLLNLCKNGGTCVPSGNKATCQCPKTFKGDFCEKAPCDTHSNLCKNGGTCDEDKKVCNCKEKTSGHLCEIVDDCKNNSTYCGDENYSGARCVFDQEENQAVCKCNNETLKFDKNSLKCRETCDSSSTKCKNGGECEGSEKDEFCNCKKGSSGNRCEIVDACIEQLHCRKDKSKCNYDTMTETAFCNCTNSKQRYDVGKNDCIPIDGCILKMIKKECTKENEVCEGGECKCKANYKYTKDKKSCEEDACASCPTGSMCDENTGYSCKCKDGEYSDGIKCVKYGKCEIGNSKCQQKCDVNTGKCACGKGFNLSPDNVSCEKMDSISTCDDLNCHPGICVERDGKKSCICPEVTHKSENNSCIDICTLSNGKPPETMNCPVDMKCESAGDRGIRCKCQDPYDQAEDGIHCKRKEMCKEPSVTAELKKKSALCREIETGKGYEIYCDKPFKFDKEGVCKKKCEFKEDECKKKNAVCELDQDYNAVCRCPPLLTKKDKDGSCSEIAKASYSGKMSFLKSKYVVENESNQRRKRSTDHVESTYTVELKKDLQASFEYAYGENFEDVKILEDCKPDGDLLECKIELQLKNKPTDVNALTSASYCYILDENFCLVKDLVVNRVKSSNALKQMDPCILEGTFCDESTKCKPDSKGTFKCACKEGFKFIRSFPILNEGNSKEICADIDECQEKTHKCPVNSTYCINTYGSYECECNTGFRKKLGNSNPKKVGCEAVCDPNPCDNDGECAEKRNHGFMCRCKSMYTGLTCNETVTAKAVQRDSKSAAIVGGVLGTLLALSLITIVLICRKMKNSKFDDDDEYMKQRQRNVLGEITRLQRQQRKENEDIEPGSRHTRLQRESGEDRN